MIRINLLEAPKPKNKRSALPSMPTMEVGDVGSPRLKVLIAFGLAAAFNLYTWYHLDTEKKAIAQSMVQAEQQNRQLSDVKTRYMARQREAENYKRRVDVIDQLRNNQQGGPVNLMAMVGETVNNTEAVWLNNMKDQGSSVDIEGMALSSDAVANLISNLQKTGYFRAVEMKESMQDETIKDMQAFTFTLSCEKSKS
jgi:type IV pilus assembly protein PilN